MKTDNPTLTTYLKAEGRYNNGKASTVDMVVMALFEEVKEQAANMRAQALKISYLETVQASSTANEECAALLLRCSKRAG
ncbi:hypothetical protein [Polaromonas hydrogenivorans]|uniref:Uncharacterized protein n=1 Tax=Polaromonas hydrogenivorans TaxID=335476 RepID=A0AAU7LRZ1_9BURK